MDQLPNMIYLATIWVIPIVIAITFHEAAHGFVARFLGDDTAWRLGRVSLNPIKHIDLVGTILLPGFLLLLSSPFLFGYAKPVPGQFSGWIAPACGWRTYSITSSASAGQYRRPMIQSCVRAPMFDHFVMAITSVEARRIQAIDAARGEDQCRAL